MDNILVVSLHDSSLLILQSNLIVNTAVQNAGFLLVALKEKVSKTTVFLLKKMFKLWYHSSRLQERDVLGAVLKIYANLISMVVYESLTIKRIL